MQPNEFIPLSKDQLFIWLTAFSNQLSKGTVIIDIHDPNLSIVHANSEFQKLTNYPLEHIIGHNLSILEGQRTNSEIANNFMDHIRHGIAEKFTLLYYTMNGSAFWSRMVIHPIRDDQHEIQYILLTCEDYTKQVLDKMLSKLEHEVYEAIDNDNKIQTILTLISEKIERYYIRDVYCTIHLSNEQQALNTIGSNTLPFEIIDELNLVYIAPTISCNESPIYVKGFLLNTTQINLFKSYHLNAIYGTWSKPILTPQSELLGVLTLFHQEDTELKQADIQYLNRLALLIQISIKYAKQKDDLRRLAFYDTETNLPNSHYFKTRLTQWIKEGKKGFMVILHASEYSKIVDLYGRNAGANLLGQIVERLSRHNSPGEELFARFSNSIVLAKITDETDITHYYSRIKPLIKEPYMIQGTENYITLKLGVTFFNSTMDIDECIHQADIALTKSHKTSGTNVAVFEENSNQKLVEEMEIFNQLSYGIENKEFRHKLRIKYKPWSQPHHNWSFHSDMNVFRKE